MSPWKERVYNSCTFLQFGWLYPQRNKNKNKVVCHYHNPQQLKKQWLISVLKVKRFVSEFWRGRGQGGTHPVDVADSSSTQELTCPSAAQDAVMASGFCDKCSRLLREFAVNLRRVCRDLEHKIREVFREICRCTCFGSSPERKTAQELESLHLMCGRNVAAFSLFEDVLLKCWLKVAHLIVMSYYFLQAFDKNIHCVH